MYYYKTILDNGQEIKFSSFAFVKYLPEKDWFINCSEPKAEYVILNDAVYRVPWLKYEPKQLKGKYPTINTEYISEEEFNEYEKKKEQQIEENERKARLLRKK